MSSSTVKDTATAFHNGEKQIQRTLGIADDVAKRTEGFIRSFMPEQHRAFFESNPFTVLGLLDHEGHPVAVPIWGNDDMINSPSPTRLQLSLALLNMTLLQEHLHLDVRTGSKIGIVGVELSTRRRNRLNGTLLHVADNTLEITVDQSFGNCPKYIHKRFTSDQTTKADVPSQTIRRFTKPTQQHLATILRADTFYIASRHNHITSDSRQGVDVSHRGGQPGFIHVLEDTLVIPDYSGNKFFNTLGNIALDSRVGLCFIDDNTGELLLIQGTATVEWDIDKLPESPGAERFVLVVVNSVIAIQGYFPMRFQITERSPYV